MNKPLLSVITALAIGVASAYASDNVVFTSSLDTEEDFGRWTVVNVNNDESTWDFDSSRLPYSVAYTYHSTNAADDWMISPAFTPTRDGKILVRFASCGSSSGESMNVFYGSEGTVDAMTNPGLDLPSMGGDAALNWFVIDAKKDEPLYLGFHAYSRPNLWRVYLANVTATEVDAVRDISFVGFTSPETGYYLGEETVKITVQNVGYDPIDTFSIALNLNGSEVANEVFNHTIPAGETYTCTMSAKVDLSERGKYVLAATVTTDGDIDGTNNSGYTEVSCLTDATVPYFMGFESDEITGGIKYYNLNEDEGDWNLYIDSGWSNMARTGYGCLAYNYDSNNAAEDWAILEPVNVEPGYYALRFWYSGDNSHIEKLSVWTGNDETPDDMKVKVADYDAILSSDYKESISIIEVTEAQKLYIGFYAYSDKNQNWLTVDDVSLTKVESADIDLAVTDIHNPEEYLPAYWSQTVSFEVRNYGITDNNATVTVSIDDNVVLSQSDVEVKAQEIREFTVSDALKDLANGVHTIKVQIATPGDIRTDNDSFEKTFTVLGTPDRIFDFEDGKIPEGFTYEVADDGTLNPDAVDEFGENGWTVIELGATSPVYGNYGLAGSTWVDGVSSVDRRIIFPAVKVVDEDAYLLWCDKALNPKYTEKYRLEIWDGESMFWGEPDWTNIYSGFAPNSAAMHGYKLNSQWKDKNLVISFRLRSDSGDAIFFDNIAFFGTDKDAGGVNTVEAGDVKVFVTGDKLIVVGEALGTRIYNMAGNCLIDSDDSSIDVSGLAKGVYVAVTATAKGTVTTKFVK